MGGRVTNQFVPLVAGTSGGLTVTNTITGLDDAESVVVVIASSAGGAMYQILGSPFHPSITTSTGALSLVTTSTFAPGFYRMVPPTGGITSSALSTGGLALVPGMFFNVVTPGVQQITILCTGNDTQGTGIGFVVKQVVV